MKKYIGIQELPELPFRFQEIECVEQHWRGTRRYSRYLTVPRPNSGIMVVVSDMCVHFRTAAGASLTAKKGDMVFLPRGLYYESAFENTEYEHGIDSYVINFNLFCGNDELFFADCFSVLGTADRSGVSGHILSLSRAIHDVKPSKLKIDSAFLLFLNSAIDAVDVSAKEFYPIRRGCMALQEEWNRNEKISKYADMCHMSETYFNALFKTWSGTTPVKYRNGIRISHAQSMLKNSGTSIDEISFLVGFHDPFYFSRVFKQMTGLSPREYRNLP